MILSELNTILSPLIPVETGVFSDTAPEKYVVLTPLTDIFDLHADNEPQYDTQAVRISLYDKGNYIKTKGESITFSTPTIEGTIMRRNKLDGKNKHPWKAEVTEEDTSVSAETITNWYKNVYEPTYSA